MPTRKTSVCYLLSRDATVDGGEYFQSEVFRVGIHEHHFMQVRYLSKPLLELPSIGSASWCKAGTDAPSFGEFSTLPERKEHAPCPHSNLTSSSPSGNSS